MLGCSAAGFAQYTGGVTVVHGHNRIRIARDLQQVRELRNASLHAEHTVGPDHATSRAGVRGQLLAKVVQVAVAIHARGAPGDRLRQPDAVDDAGVVQRIAHHEVTFAHDAMRQSLVGGPRRHVAHGRFRADKSRQRLLELPMDGERAADETHRTGAGTELVQAVDPGLHHTRLVAQPEIVVRGEDQHLALALHLHPRRLRTAQIVERLVHAIGLQLSDVRLQFGGEPGIQ